jgi:aspartyl protease family protein
LGLVRGRILLRHAALVLVCVTLMAAAMAGPSVRVLALFPDKAMLEIDGQRKVLAAGQTGPGGVRLLSADSNHAVVEIEGRQEELRLGSVVSARYQPRPRREIRILKDASGSYFLDGLINGQPVRFLVDTGASSIAMSELQSAQLGIQHRVDGVRIGIQTASGSAVGHRVELSSVSLGGIQLHDVAAMVIDGDSPRNVLLGMNVLSQFEIDQRENLLILRSKF